MNTGLFIIFFKTINFKSIKINGRVLGRYVGILVIIYYGVGISGSKPTLGGFHIHTLTNIVSHIEYNICNIMYVRGK